MHCLWNAHWGQTIYILLYFLFCLNLSYSHNNQLKTTWLCLQIILKFICCPLKITQHTPINVSTAGQSENVQIRHKKLIFCVATIIFHHCLNPLGHGVHQSFTGCHWSLLPLFHDDITELVRAVQLISKAGFVILHHLFSNGAAVNTQSRSSLTS